MMPWPETGEPFNALDYWPPTVCFGCWEDISRSNANYCCATFRCSDCHKKHTAEDDELWALITGDVE